MSTELTTTEHTKYVELFRVSDDVLIDMVNELDDISKCRLIRCCKKLNSMKHRFVWISQVSLFSIMDVSYFHNFTNIIIPKTDKKLPSIPTINSISSVKINDTDLPLPNNTIYLEVNTSLKIQVGSKNKIKHLTLERPDNDPLGYEYYLFEGLTHITFKHEYPSLRMIPTTVTYLDTGYEFYGLVTWPLPRNLEYLRVGIHYKDLIEKKIIKIPSSIKIEYIPVPLPNSITHLTFGSDFNQPLINLPNQVTNLTFQF